jgi:hypothetical protein
VPQEEEADVAVAVSIEEAVVEEAAEEAVAVAAVAEESLA